MSVSLTPSASLAFNRPLTQTGKRNLTVTNHNSQPVAFKVKTTAPKLYCVRPNSGRIGPGESVDVQVLLQALKEEPSITTKCKDKFLIQSTLITPEKETLSLPDLWDATDGVEETKVHQQKIKVVFLPPEGQTLEEEDEGRQDSSYLSPPDNRYQTVRQLPSTGNGHAAEPLSFSAIPASDSHAVPEAGDQSLDRPGSPSADFTAAHEEQREEIANESFVPEEPSIPIVNVNVHTPSIPSPAPPIVSSATHDTDPEVAAKYAEALAEIQRLRELLAAVPAPSSPNELRRRTRPLSDVDSTVGGETEVGTMIEEPLMSEGVPLQIVIMIAVGVFITTYLFF